ncbi:serine/threonine-protein kinase [Mycobacterium sp. pUA109]|uniref:serine/threonine-protein kinase n=1 Tax=Mycobacterium sp. pUA109 TaxID=3238982 RepID=UPI00351AB29E
MWLSSGATFAGYTIERLLGFGAMGEVYLAQRAGLTRYDALKILPAAMTADVEFRERFTREAQTATTLHHPHIVDAHQRGESDGRLWTAMDYIDGDSATQVVAQRYPSGMPVAEALGIVAALAGALDYARRRGILHRAVKPSNVLLTNDDEPRILLVDFGIAPIGQTPATLHYAAPEQVTGGVVDERTDQYGLAATAVYLLTGAPPQQQSDLAAPKLGDRRPDLAPLDDVLAVALAPNPTDRFGRCGEFAAALSQRAHGRSGVYRPDAGVIDYPDDPEPPASGAASRRRTRALVGAAALALIPAALLAGILIGRHTDAPAAPVAGPAPSAPVPSPMPTSTTAAEPAPDQLLDGAYQVDVNRAQQTFNDTPAPQPPNVSTWWAFRSSCSAAGCVATGIQLDDTDHQRVSPAAASQLLMLDFRDGAWQSRPQTLRFPCVGPSGAAANETTIQALRLQPQPHGPMHGVMTVTVETDECGQRGGKIEIPAVAGRVGAVPPGVTVPR